MSPKKDTNVLPIIIIGGGPAGMLAAIAASKGPREVILFNKNPWPGKKISAIPSEDLFFSEKLPAKKLAAKFKDKAEFVAPIFKAFGYINFVRLCKKMNLNLEVDQAGHFRANGLPGQSFIDALLEEVIRRGVQYKKSSRVSDVYIENNKVAGIISNSSRLPASEVIIATGSFSSPKYGATIDGYLISEKLGHRVNKLKPALIDLIVFEKYGKILAGETFENIKISIYFNSKPTYSEIGEIKFKSNSISGSTILNYSAEIIEKLPLSPVEIRLDFMPEQPREAFEAWLIKEFISRKNIYVERFLSRYFNDNVIKAIQTESKIKLDKSIVHVTNLERKSLIRAIKDFRITIKAPKPFNSTCGVLGGVSTDDIDPLTCESKIVKSLYFAGDVMDVLGPWGGYNMQFAFSSGYVAGTAAAVNSA